jgi:hypothetical protein
LTLYGATMLAVQGVENQIAGLYLLANHDPTRRSNASTQRQVRTAFDRSWSAFQKGSAGMKLNDTKVGLKPHLDPDLYRRLDRFITGPRAELAHRFLVERMALRDEGESFRPGTDFISCRQRSRREPHGSPSTPLRRDPRLLA